MDFFRFNFRSLYKSFVIRKTFFEKDDRSFQCVERLTLDGVETSVSTNTSNVCGKVNDHAAIGTENSIKFRNDLFKDGSGEQMECSRAKNTVK